MEINNSIIDLDKYVQISKSGDVYKVREKSTNEIYEANPILMDDPNDDQEKRQILKHLSLLQTLDNPAIIKFCGFSLTGFDGNIFPLLFTKYMDNGSLKTLFQSLREGSPPKEWNNTKMIINIIGIALGMKYLHKDRNFIHNNLNPSNILLDSEYYPKITGIQQYSHKISPERFLMNFADNIVYCSPELFNDDADFSNKPDIFSFSMILYEFYTKSVPIVKGNTKFQVGKNISRGMRPDTSKLEDHPIEDLIEKCWAQDPDDRPDFEEIVSLFIDNKNLWPDDVNEDEVQSYLEKFGLSLPNRKDIKNQLESLKQKYEAKLKEQAEKFKKKIKQHKQKEEEQENKIKELQDQVKDLQSKKEEKSQNNNSNISLTILDEETIQSLEKVEEIGFGGGGKVFKVKKPETYALKEMKIQNSTTENLKNFLNEYEIMNMLKHPNILKTYGILLNSEKIPPSILLEYCSMNLDTAILNHQLSNEQIAIAIYQIAEGMKYVHFKNIIHRDLKPTNILIAFDGSLKICDFGISKLMSVEEQSMTRGVGTQKYMAPEIINEEENYDQKVDVYSFGVLVYFILSGGEIPKIKMFDILKGKKADIPDNFTDLSKNLISRCWNFKSKERPSFKEIVDLLDENQYKVIELKNSELKFVKAFVKAHKEKLPIY